MQNKESVTEGTNRDTYKKKQTEIVWYCEVLPSKRLMAH